MSILYQSIHTLRRGVKRVVPFAFLGLAALITVRAAEHWIAPQPQWPQPLQLIGKGVNELRVALAAFGVVFVVCLGLILMSGRALAQTTDLKNLQSTIERVVAAQKLPAAGGAFVTSNGVQSFAVAGMRKRGEQIAATSNDLWHLGSNGKAMTAAMIARLVERGAMRWSQTLAETFPELVQEMSEPMRGITIEQLLSHRAGLDANFDLRRYVGRKDLNAARVDVLKDAIRKGLSNTPGEKFLYSNWGYTIASAMAERATGKTFENLMREEVFAPLSIKSAGFQGTGTPGKINQPWPHTSNGKPAPENGPDMDNVPTMAAAGTIHMTLPDYAIFIAEILKAAQGKSVWLKRESVESLLQPRGDNYALGWLVPERGWAGGRAMHHGGDNTMNFAVVWGSPKRDFAAIFVTNQSGANRAGDEFVTAVITAASQTGSERR
ncbi:MAG: class A beta-lactamase-related serine hydrolase [Betaproteobacteria bacterium]|nr:MAG: class A beta-lactamase-related serine hydrolase [Betaproteobacteria bacterium]